MSSSQTGDGCRELPVIRYSDEGMREAHAQVIEELQLDIVLDGRCFHALTCSPWDIAELAAGYLYLQGALLGKDQIESLVVDEKAGIVEVVSKEAYLKQGVSEAEHSDLTQHNDVAAKPPCQDKKPALPIIDSKLKLSAAVVNTIAGKLFDSSGLFDRTGGVHSAALFEGTALVARLEDIGRHSAVDKLAGWCLLNDYDASNSVVLFSGRMPLEITTKVIRLNSPIIISQRAPTNLSIDLAIHHGITLIGLAKNGRFTVFTHPERVTGDGV